MKLPITIEYNSGEQETYIAAPPEWSKWEIKTGKTIREAKDAIGISDLMFLAYQSYKRTNAGKQVKPYDIWELTVADVRVDGDDDPKDTQADQ